MTGPEHYREAERLLGRSRLGDGDHGADDTSRANLAAAQVHATLALAAATALNDGQYGLEHSIAEKWKKAAT